MRLDEGIKKTPTAEQWLYIQYGTSTLRPWRRRGTRDQTGVTEDVDHEDGSDEATDGHEGMDESPKATKVDPQQVTKTTEESDHRGTEDSQIVKEAAEGVTNETTDDHEEETGRLSPISSRHEDSLVG
ncbi:hypothetical protein ACHAQC_005040 [Fusarium culmorum]